MRRNVKAFFSILACFLLSIFNQNCSGVSSQSLQDLASNHTSETIELDLPSLKARVGDRIFIASVFAEIFLPQNGDALTKEQAIDQSGLEAAALMFPYITTTYQDSHNEILEVISENILEKVEDFHGSCSILERDGTCASKKDDGGRIAQASVDSFAASTAVREGYRMSTCTLIIEKDQAVQNLILNLTGDRDMEIAEEHVLGIYDLFYPEQKMNEGVYQSLVELLEAASSGSEKLDAWRSVIVPICNSVGWQIP